MAPSCPLDRLPTAWEPRGSEPGHGVPEPTVQPNHQVEMAAGGEAGGADITDDLPLPDTLTHMNYVPTGVIVARSDVFTVDVAVVDRQPLAIARVVVALGHPTCTGSPDSCATPSAKVGAIVQLPVVEHRVKAHTERGGDARPHRIRKAMAGVE